MGIRWGRQASPRARLLKAAGVDPKPLSAAPDHEVMALIAFVVMRDSSAAKATLSTAEELLADESAYEMVITFLEQAQHLVSHRLPMFLSPEEVIPLLGSRCAVCWTTLTDFWSAVATWCVDNRPPLESTEKILSVENERLQMLLWTANRTLPTGAKLGLAEAVRYEKASGAGIPGFSHIDAALHRMGPT